MGARELQSLGGSGNVSSREYVLALTFASDQELASRILSSAAEPHTVRSYANCYKLPRSACGTSKLPARVCARHQSQSSEFRRGPVLVFRPLSV